MANRKKLWLCYEPDYGYRLFQGRKPKRDTETGEWLGDDIACFTPKMWRATQTIRLKRGHSDPVEVKPFELEIKEE